MDSKMQKNENFIKKYLKKETGGILSGIVVFIFILIVLAFLVNDDNSSSSKHSNNEPSATSFSNLNDFENDALEKNLVTILKDLNMDPSLVGYINQHEDWAHGNLYSFTYDVMETYYIYAYENGDILNIQRSLNGPTIYENNNISFSEETTESIVLKDGELGEYGKHVTYNGTQYIKYFVPAGTYEVKALVKGSMFFIESQTIYKNYAGYDESEVLSTVSLANKGDTQTITIDSNSCINLTIGTNISLTKK